MELNEQSLRDAIVEEAISWIGTPFHDDACKKGKDGGVDCARFVAACYIASGATKPFDIEPYTAQWFLHHTEERLKDFVLKFGKQIKESDAKKGDLVLYKIGRAFAHAAIIIDWPNELIHAHTLSQMVVKGIPDQLDLRGKERQFFSIWAK